MKTTDSAMREFKKEIKVSFDCIWINAANWERSKLPGKQVPSVYKMASKNLEKLYSHSLAEARREWVEEIRGMKKKRLDSPRGLGDGQVVNVAPGYNQAIDDVLDLLTGDNPERKV